MLKTACSMLSDFSGLISPDSEILNEILERSINLQTIHDDIFSNDYPQTSDDDIFSAVTECVDQLINDVVKETTTEKKKLTRKRSINKYNQQKNTREKAYQSGKTYVNSKGKQIEEKKIKLTKGCFSNCKFKRRQKIK